MSISTESVWQAFHEPLGQFIRRQARDESAAEDILQDVFVKIHTHIDSLKDERKLQGWLYRIARNAIYDYYRSQRPTAELSETLDLLEELPEDDMERELLPCLAEMVQRLPDDYRQALILTEYEGLTQKELAQRLGISLSGAKSRVQRAREKLKRMLLACCHFEFDRRGKIIDYQPRCACCTTAEASSCQCQEGCTL
jgi:RNA polymerase sigma-70 factor, ECF subfamily